MITLVKHNLILNGYDFNNEKEIEYKKHENLISLLVEEFPDGFDTPNSIYINNIKIIEEEYDIKLNDDDVIVIMFHPMDPVSLVAIGSAIWASIGTFVINAAISLAVSYALSKVFGPDIPEVSSGQGQDTIPNGSPTYSLNSNQNTFRAGERIPTLYGRVRTYPSLIAPPYRVYQDNQQYLYLLMAIGQGQYILNNDDIYVSNTRVSDLSNDLIQWKLINGKDVPKETDIEKIVNEETYHQIIYTSPEVSDLIITDGEEYYNYNMSFSGNQISFGLDRNGGDIDLSLLSNGDDFYISGSLHNDTGETTPIQIDTVDNINKTLTFQSHTFVTEPTVVSNTTDLYSGTLSDNENYYNTYTLNNIIDEAYDKDNFDIADYPIKKGEVITLDNNGNLEEYTVTYDAYWIESEETVGKQVATFKVDRDVSPQILYNTTTEVKELYTYCAVAFKKIHGQFNCNPEGTKAQYVEVDVEFPSGLYEYDNGSVIEKNIQMEALVETEDGVIDSTILSFRNNKAEPYRKTVRYAVNSPEKYAKISFRRLTPSSTDVNVQDEIHITAIKTPIIEYGDNDYGDVQLLWVKAKASNALSSKSQFQINCWVERADVGSNINSVLTDIYTNPNYGAGLDEENLDLVYTDAVFNGAFDNNINLLDAMRKVARVGKISVFPSGSSVKTIEDNVRPLRTSLFNETNIIKDSFSIQYLFGEDEGYDGYEVTYRDPDTFKPEVETYPNNSINPIQVELVGCTDSTVALSEATYRFKSDESRRQIVEFETDVQGLVPNVLDRVAVSHNVYDYGMPNTVSRVIDSNTIKLREKIDDSFNTIIFRNDDGSPSDLISFTKIDDYNINVVAPNWVHDIFGDNDYEATKVSLGTSEKIVQDFIITKITPSQNNKVKIEGVNYDPSIYEVEV